MIKSRPTATTARLYPRRAWSSAASGLSVLLVTQKCESHHCAAAIRHSLSKNVLAGPVWTGWWHRMSPDLAMISDGKKFMWDGQLYDNREEASRAGESYQGDNFEIRMVEEGGKFLVYSRRTVKEVVVTAQ
jgi:hypothetical protein